MQTTTPNNELESARAELSKAAKDALQCQDACNFSGVEHSFHNACNAIRVHMRATDTFSSGKFAAHPVIYLFMSKLVSLMHTADIVHNLYGYNSTLCEQIAAGDFHSVEATYESDTARANGE